MKNISAIALALTIIGGINWLLVGAFNFNLVTTLFGVDTALTKIVYILVGISALYCITLFRWFSSDAPTLRSNDTTTTYTTPTV